jgi:heme exporter protein A
MTERQVFPPLSLIATALVCGRGGMALTPKLTFSVPPGQCLLLRGPNGTGKTTLVLTLAGIVTPLEGTVTIAGADAEEGPQLHYCGHRNAIKPRLTVAENLDFWRMVNGARSA